MIYAETQANQKWCPMARSGDFRGWDGGEPYGISNAPMETKCCASQCMMWRFCDPDSAAPSLRQGFCGLAGKPGVIS